MSSVNTSPSTRKLPWESLGMPRFPIMLAPLAGVSDHPFRRVCANNGADLTYVEMISAAALVYESPRTYDMLKRHDSERILGVQVTGRTAEELGKAVEILDRYPFDTIDINMGCPVQKVVKNGCGSAILKDPVRVHETVKAARAATRKPLSVKVRLGWDHSSKNVFEVAKAAEEGGADWITVHGRTRSDDYSAPVDLEMIGGVKSRVAIPVIGNGNLFTRRDLEHMAKASGVDGVMVSRGALGNPWVFGGTSVIPSVTLSEWLATVMSHLEWHGEEYGQSGTGALTMRKHLLWYLRGWPGGKPLKDSVNQMTDLNVARAAVKAWADELAAGGIVNRFSLDDQDVGKKFLWDPKYEMDRRLDRGVGDDGLLVT